MTKTTHVKVSTENQKNHKSMTAVSLCTYLEREFYGSELEMSKRYGFTSQQIKRWLENDAVVIENAIYLNKSGFPETEKETSKRFITLASVAKNPNKDPVCFALNDHIEMEYSGNQTAFAKANCSTQQQVFRWSNKSRCVYLCDQIYRHQIDLVLVTK